MDRTSSRARLALIAAGLFLLGANAASAAQVGHVTTNWVSPHDDGGVAASPGETKPAMARPSDGDTYTSALNLLAAQGYADFRDFHAVGPNYEATVMQNGQPFRLMIDPAAGTIQRGN